MAGKSQLKMPQRNALWIFAYYMELHMGIPGLVGGAIDFVEEALE